MVNIPRIVFVVSIATMLCLATANAITIAVLEIITANDEMDLTVEETRFLTDELRRQATVLLPKEYSVLTREKIISLVSQATGNLSTAIDIGLAIKSEYVTQGFIGKLGNMFTLTIELYETSSGRLLGYFVKETTDLKGLLDAIRENSPTLFAKTTQKESLPAPAIAIPALPPPTATQQPIAVPANKPAEPPPPTYKLGLQLGVQMETNSEPQPQAAIPTNIPAAETQKSEGGGLGWRGITRIAIFSATAILGAATIYKHIESRNRFEELDGLKSQAVNTKEWINQYNAKADEFIEKEKQRNIFATLTGVCALSGAVTFFF